MKRIIIQNIHHLKYIPRKQQLNKWVNRVLKKVMKNYEITIRFVNIKEIIILNNQYRNKNTATNIISFQMDSFIKKIETEYLGDLVICMPFIIKESKLKRIKLINHLAHLIIHGLLHLLGYDHTDKKTTLIMEKLEIKHLRSLGIRNPYL